MKRALASIDAAALILVGGVAAATPGWRQWMLATATNTNNALNAAFASSHTYIS